MDSTYGQEVDDKEDDEEVATAIAATGEGKDCGCNRRGNILR